MKRLSKAFQSLGSSSGGSSGLRHHAIGIGVGCLITLAWLLLSNTAPYRKYVELKGLDLLYLLRPSFEESKSIVHIDIDEKSLEQIGRWPWPRDVHGHLVEVLTDFGAAGIGFDIEFPEKSQVIVDRRRLAEDLALGGVSPSISTNWRRHPGKSRPAGARPPPNASRRSAASFERMPANSIPPSRG